MRFLLKKFRLMSLLNNKFDSKYGSAKKMSKYHFSKGIQSLNLYYRFYC